MKETRTVLDATVSFTETAEGAALYSVLVHLHDPSKFVSIKIAACESKDVGYTTI
jgi:hypothetical protein